MVSAHAPEHGGVTPQEKGGVRVAAWCGRRAVGFPLLGDINVLGGVLTSAVSQVGAVCWQEGGRMEE